MARPHLAEFGSIDQTADAGYFVRFLDAACAAESFQAYKRRLNELLDVRAGRRFLDAGCGTGDDARAMAALVAPDGLVAGIDNSQSMIDVARQRAAGTGLPVEFTVADVLHLPYDADSFDGCRADRSLMHVPDARQALAEMLRVTRPGGRVAVYEVDFGALTINAADRQLGRRIINAWCDSVRNGWLARYIPELLTDLGLRDVTVAPHTLMLTPELSLLLLGPGTVERAVEQGTVTRAEGQAWLQHMEELQRTGRFFSTLTGFLVAGRK
jgi:ubiquinone/menaquinone biosynthesis C-methylase UbiE